VLVGLNFMTHMNLSEEITYEGAKPNDPVIVNFTFYDFKIRTMDYNAVGVELTYSHQLKNMGFFVAGHLDYLMAADNLKRMISSVKIGFSF